MLTIPVMKQTIPVLVLVMLLGIARADDPILEIRASQTAGKVSPMLYGLMTEEINHAYDGGLYAELIQNRAFTDDATEPIHWAAVQANGAAANIALDPAQPFNGEFRTSLRLQVVSASPSAAAGVANDGYWGIPVKPDTRYQASFYAKAAPGFSGPLTVAIVSTNGTLTYAQAQVRHITSEWQRYETTLKTGSVQPTAAARLTLSVTNPATVWFGPVSLFPPTWKNRPNGLRPDLMQMLVDLKPAFLRLPGGNYLEGDTIQTRFDWKKTLGPVSQRPGHPGCWGYRSSDGLGLMEFLLWCEDMGAEPVLAVYAGYSLKGAYVKPGEDLEPFVQEALEEIEYVTGPTTTKWGAQRAEDGHPKPFPLHYVEIGNEDWFDKSGSYDGRFAQFQMAIKTKYPRLKCISTVGNEQPADKRVHTVVPGVLDEHYYRSAAEFLKDAPTRFERYDRSGPEIFVGEWAAYEEVKPWESASRQLPRTPTMKAALGDAAWMAAMERNSDLISMQCYAPLLVNVNAGASQWRPDLIGYDALRAFGSPSYYAFQMFSRHHGDSILKATLTEGPLQSVVTRDSRTGRITIKLVNPQPAPQAVAIHLNEVRSVAPEADAIILAADPNDGNSIEEPTKVMPVTSKVRGIGPSFSYVAPASSIVVLQVDAR